MSEFAQVLALVCIAAGLLLVARLLTPFLQGSAKPLRTKPLKVRELGPGLPALSAEALAAAQQAAAGANIAPFQNLAQQVEAKKAAGAQRPADEEVLEPEPPLADPEAELRRRVIRERLQAMARRNPQAVAGVLQSWMSERR